MSRRQRQAIEAVRLSGSGVAGAPPAGTRVFIVSECCTFYPPFTAGGTERQLSELALSLTRAGTEVTVSAREPTLAPPSISGQRLNVRYVGPGVIAKGIGWAALRPNLLFIANTLRLLVRERRRYDTMLVSGFRQLAPPCALLARLIGKRCVVRIESAWDLENHLTPESSERIGHLGRLTVAIAIKCARRATFALAHQIVAFSDRLQAELAALGAPQAKIRRVPNGVDTQRFAPATAEEKSALRRRLDLPPGKTIYIYTGRICRSKGMLDLLHAWRQCVDRADLHLVIVGSGAGAHDDCEDEVRRFALDHRDGITIGGLVANVDEYLRAADAYIFLSHQEAFSLALLEALATGLPCIATDVGGAREVIAHHDWGALVEPRAPSETVLREITWLQSRRDLWPSMGARARERIVECYSLDAVAHRYVELLRAARRSDGAVVTTRIAR